MVGRGFGVLLLAAIALSAAPAAAQTASKCTAQKYKAVGKYAQALAGCRARTLAKGLPADSLCGAKALLKLQIAFEKAERKGDCLGTRDDSFAAGETEGYFETLTPVLESTLSCCSFGGIGDACAWLEDPETCTVSLGGTLGAPGSVCDGATGDCIAPPAADGACCSFEGDISCQGESSPSAAARSTAARSSRAPCAPRPGPARCPEAGCPCVPAWPGSAFGPHCLLGSRPPRVVQPPPRR